MPIIWPLAAKLRQPVFLQQRPNWTGNLPVPKRTINLPWNAVGRPELGDTSVEPRVVHNLIPVPSTQFGFVGISRDSTGAALGNCTVKLYRERDDFAVETTVSDANGSYRFVSASTVETYYVRWYLAGSPDRAGTSKNTLIPS